MTKSKIRVRLKAFDHRVIDDAAKKILDTALATGAKVVVPVPLPTHRKLVTVLTSPTLTKTLKSISNFSRTNA